ncbi:MAG: bifunctional precorrin-2 dehydrogenase/sirohydrochlorin ferrochelatase [Lachnospiraceae bacterium]|nr:bifunctional precorrin-2 dehydrogenase/sirohydrochlorin ferrochelatase [Lachnospiraceae bacterium]
MHRKFPLFLDITDKKIVVYGAGRIATRRVETLLAFAPSLTVVAPEASGEIREAETEGKLAYCRACYVADGIPADAWMVLAATDDAEVNAAIGRECRQKGILVNVCSDRRLCDFQFPGIAWKDDLVVGVNAGGNDHRLARRWTEKIQKEVAGEWKEI